MNSDSESKVESESQAPSQAVPELTTKTFLVLVLEVAIRLTLAACIGMTALAIVLKCGQLLVLAFFPGAQP